MATGFARHSPDRTQSHARILDGGICADEQLHLPAMGTAKKAYIPPTAGWRRAGYDAFAMAVYVAVVYGASLTIGALGRDYAFLANPGESACRLVGWALSAEVRWFGDAAWAYHLVNLGLLYLCMLFLYRLTIRLIGGPWWLGTLAATLFMANPVHSESALNLCGCVDLIPCLTALAAITVYVESAVAPRLWNVVLAPVLFGLAVQVVPHNAMLLLPLILFELLLAPRGGKPALRLALPVAFTAVAWYLSPGMLSRAWLDPAGMFAPLYFIVYPFGFLPSTARTFVAHPSLGWVAAAAVVFILFLIYRKARRPVLLFGLFAALSMRLFQGDAFVDPVHLIGGGQMLAANAFIAIALVALFYRVMDHPKWRRPVVMLTTLLCAVFFVLEFRSVLAWREASALTRDFQCLAAADSARKSPAEPVTILPDVQYYRGAPICFSASVAFKTPFSTPVPAAPLLPLNYERGLAVNVEGSVETGITATVAAASPVDLLCYPYSLSKEGGRLETRAAGIDAESIAPERLVLRIKVKDAGPEPQRVPPGLVNPH